MNAKIKFLSAMGIFGTIGILVRYIPLSSAAIAFCRGVLGSLFLLLFIRATNKKLSLDAIRKNLLILCLSGAAIGFNWILLFEAYRYTTVATATVCYYLAPVFLLLSSPLLGEKLNAKKLISIFAALIGIILVSGIAKESMPAVKELRGILLGLGAAALYASAMFLNKKLSSIASYDKTVVQLGMSSVVILPYLLISEGFGIPVLSGIQIILLLIAGIVHTGIAYTLYFGSIKNLSTQSVAIFSYFDPVIAIVLSALLLKEPISFSGILGSLLILGSALYSQISDRQ